MKGLILKDLLNLKQQGKTYILFFAMWGVISFLNNDVYFFSGFIVMIAAMLPVTALAYDERAKWDKYGLSMPVSKYDYVLSKYVLGGVLTFIGCLVSLLINIYLIGVSMESVMIPYVMFGAGLLVISTLLPIMFKYGAEKGRTMMFIVFLVPTLLITMLTNLNINISNFETILENILYLTPVGAVVLTFISIQISTNIFKKKEI